MGAKLRMDETRLLRALKALAHPKRFRMIREIAAAGELSCRQIGERFPLSQPTVSHHLKILGEAGLLRIRQNAQHHLVSVNRGLIEQVVSVLPASLEVGRDNKAPADGRAVETKGPTRTRGSGR